MVGQFIVDEDGEGEHCISVDNNLDNSDSIQANDNGEQNVRGKCGTRWADDESTSQMDKSYDDFLLLFSL